jgi:hypothetical protein
MIVAMAAAPGELDVMVDRGATQDEMAALVAVFERVGVRATVRDDVIRLSGGVLPYVVNFIAPLKWVAFVFAGGFAGKAGADTWDSFREGGWQGLRLFLDEVAATRASEGTVTVRSPGAPDVQLYEAIPDQALQELADLDWERMGPGRLGWSEEGWHYLVPGAAEVVPAPRRR